MNAAQEFLSSVFFFGRLDLYCLQYLLTPNIDEGVNPILHVGQGLDQCGNPLAGDVLEGTSLDDVHPILGDLVEQDDFVGVGNACAYLAELVLVFHRSVDGRDFLPHPLGAIEQAPEFSFQLLRPIFDKFGVNLWFKKNHEVSPDQLYVTDWIIFS
jgi:hypothetical protein